MSKTTVELAVLLVDEIFGDLCSCIFSTLLQHGRLQLYKLYKLANISLQAAKNGLTVLIQHNIIRHHTPLNESTCYEANIVAAYFLVRIGKYVGLLEQELGSNSGRVAAKVLHQGYIHSRDLDLASTSASNGLGSNQTPFTSDGHSSNGTYAQPFSRPAQASYGNDPSVPLKSHRYLRPINLSHFRSAQDNFLVARQRLMFQSSDDNGESNKSDVRKAEAKHAGASAKEKAEMDKRAKAVANLWDECRLEPDKLGDIEPTTLKRPAPTTDSSQKLKKVKLSAGNKLVEDKSYEYAKPFLIDMEHGRMCIKKYNVLARNQTLVRVVFDRIGSVTSEVYAVVLRVATAYITDSHNSRQPRDADADENLYFRAEQLIDELPTGLTKAVLDSAIGSLTSFGSAQQEVNSSSALLNSLAYEENGLGIHNGPNIPQSNGNIRVHSQAMKQAILKAVTVHLRLLAEDSFSFLQENADSTDGSWIIDFRAITKKLRQLEIEKIIHEKFGDYSLRLARFLNQKGKVEEKQIQSSVLMPQKSMRALLTTLQSAGFLELQEIPRENSKSQVSRTMFLWFFHPDRCARNILEDAIQTMSRCFQRIRFEREELKSLIEKAERTDVKGNEDQYLTSMEQSLLKDWDRKEERLLAQISRLDDTVAIFRDF